MSNQWDNNNPTKSVNLNFIHYLEHRHTKLSKHIRGEVSDYSFSLDGKLRRQIASVGPIRSITQIVASVGASIQTRQHQVQSIAVGPEQYPEIYALGKDCARCLGIPIPRIFVMTCHDPAIFTLIGDEMDSTIVISTGLKSMLDINELKFMVGHECGHTHNQHGVYNTAVIMLGNPIAKVMLQNLLSAGSVLGTVRLVASAIYGSLRLFLMNWSRCADITCDRAGLICCGDLGVAERALTKLITDGAELSDGFNVDAYLKQVEQAESASHRYVQMTQPYIIEATRIRALRLFAQCDVYKEWHSELKDDIGTLSKEDVDRKCEKMLDL